MVCSFSARSVWARVLAASLLFATAWLSTAIADDTATANDIGQKFAAHLAAGEFGPAKQLANQGGSSRDRMFQQLSAAQSRAGARFGSLSTAADIGNDVQRQSAYSELSNHPVMGGGRGGAALADFDSLTELIKSTISPDSWDDAGGAGAAEPFPGGVYVDAAGTLKRLSDSSIDPTLIGLRKGAILSGGNRDVRQKSTLRKVSLTRLERQVQWLAAQGKNPDDAMKVLAGLTKIKYILVYPDTRDVVLAGPAGDWNTDAEGRLVNSETLRPTLRLDDFVVVLRNALTNHGRFGCSITPRQENLANVQSYLTESSKRSLRPGERDEWLAELRERLGNQEITVQGLDPRTHAARTLVEADYRMKLVGMGLEPGVLGVRSYLDSIEVKPGASPPPMDVLRWWFTLNYDSVKTTEARDAFELLGPGVKVLSENEMLNELGERIHTGSAQNLNRLFAQSFTKHFEQLAAKYPVYAELRNVFDLALVAAIIRGEDLAEQCDWHLTHFGEQGTYRVELGTAPKQVASVINHRELDRKHFVVGVSGGVSVDTQSVASAKSIKTDTYGLLKAERGAAAPPALAKTAWWWD
jgi:hypothetical protein